MQIDKLTFDVFDLIGSLSADYRNVSITHGALLLVKARALRKMGSLDAALKTCTQALLRPRERSRELINSILYERALINELMGYPEQAEFDYLRIYSVDPNHRDVAAKLGFDRLTNISP